MERTHRHRRIHMVPWRALLLATLSICIQSVYGGMGPLKEYPLLSTLLAVQGEHAGNLAAINRSTFCPAREDPGVPCQVITNPGLCLGQYDLEQAFGTWMESPIRQSYFDRYDLEIGIEIQAEPSSRIMGELFRTLLTEVYGYSVRIIQNDQYRNQLTRCREGKYHFHTQIWRTDWSDEEWQEYVQIAPDLDDTSTSEPDDGPSNGSGTKDGGTGTSKDTTAEDDGPFQCITGGPSGIQGRNGWYADAYSITQAAQEQPRPITLGYHLAYSTQESVAGLPKFDMQEAEADEVNVWFIPPICRDPTVQCGLAYASHLDWERGVAQQQIVNLNWKIAVVFCSDESRFFKLIDTRILAHEQVLFIYFSPDTYTASAHFVRVALPDPEFKCYSGSHAPTPTGVTKMNRMAAGSNDTDIQGNGPIFCDFRSQSLLKLYRLERSVEGRQEMQDAIGLFLRAELEHESLLGMLGSLRQSAVIRPQGTAVEDASTANSTDIANTAVITLLPIPSEADISCTWLRENPSVWSAWVRKLTPRTFQVDISKEMKATVYAFVGIFLLFSLGSHVFLFLFRNEGIIRRSSYVFNQLTCFGSIAIYISLLISIQSDSFSTCIASQWMLSIGFTCFYVSILTKTHRIDRLFSATNELRSISLPDSKMLLYLFSYMLLDLSIVALWTIISPPDRQMEDHPSIPHAEVSRCQSKHSNKFKSALLILRAVTLITGAISALRIRNVQAEWNESKFLVAITYNIACVCAVIVGISLVAPNDPTTSIGAWLAGVALAVFASLLLFMLPKMALLLSPKLRRAVGLRSSGVMGAHQGAAGGPGGIGTNNKKSSTTIIPQGRPGGPGMLFPQRIEADGLGLNKRSMGGVMMDGSPNDDHTPDDVDQQQQNDDLDDIALAEWVAQNSRQGGSNHSSQTGGTGGQAGAANGGGGQAGATTTTSSPTIASGTLGPLGRGGRSPSFPTSNGRRWSGSTKLLAPPMYVPNPMPIFRNPHATNATNTNTQTTPSVEHSGLTPPQGSSTLRPTPQSSNASSQASSALHTGNGNGNGASGSIPPMDKEFVASIHITPVLGPTPEESSSQPPSPLMNDLTIPEAMAMNSPQRATDGESRATTSPNGNLARRIIRFHPPAETQTNH